MTLGPWYVGDTPAQDIVVSVLRDGAPADLSGYTTGDVLLIAPDRTTFITWSGSVTVAGSSVTIPKPTNSPFQRPGMYPLFVRLRTPGGITETFDVGAIEVRAVALTWPPQLWEIKDDAKLRQDDTADDARLQTVLDAAVTFVERIKRGKVDFSNNPVPVALAQLPAPSPDIRLGTIRLAYRWHVRRRSPEMLATAGELGQSRIPSFDPDIERLLGIGRKRGLTFA